ncbi:hypothetical protein ACMAZD_00875 [Vibrio sp. nBUS_14]|uniref:hypothetical protein n=1 Tax=Vibrio sp. nBUS_14 TaxID=3395321 RepID=UPI003EBE1F4F
MNIEISEEINQRLSAHRVGFETQEQVIERLLDHYETKDNLNRPIVEFIPNEPEFKKNLVQKKSAWKELHFNDGSVKVEEWIASQFKETSSLRSNIWSGPLRDWKSKGIKKLILSTEKTKAIATNQRTVEIQVGKFVKAHIYNIIELCKTNDQYKKQLVSKEWCHDNLCIQFPFLLSTKWVREENLHERYWTAEYKIAMWSYRVCSQFGGSTLVGGKTLSEQHGNMFLRHLKENDLLLPEFQNKQIKFIVKRA